MLPTKKGAVELSINTIVIVLISLVILGSGMMILMNFITSSEEIKGMIDQQTETQIENLLTQQGRKVAFPFNQVSLNRGNAQTVGLGVMNIKEGPQEFDVKITYSASKENSGNKIVMLYDSDNFKLEENENKKIPILIQVPKNAPNDEYIYDIKVYSGKEQYGNTQKLYVIVS